RKGLFTDQVVVHVGYDIENLTDPKRAAGYKGPITSDYYGRQVPKSAHGSQNLGRYTSSTKRITEAVCAVYDRIVDRNLTVRRFNVIAAHLLYEEDIKKDGPELTQLDLFTDYDTMEKEKQAEEAELDKERRMQNALLSIRDRYGKNSIVKGLNMRESATAMERNKQIGGHRA
ncbi:MAG: DNA methylase, partial [Oscillospiraceae bacterium]|nr:DNA methylase [Oscillospiraceae bacterium]